MRLRATRRTTVMAGVAVLVVGTASLGLAAARDSGPFGDVDATDSHAADIAWLKDNGITMGCGEVDGTVTFCPDDGATRAQMASFLRRLAESGVVDAGSVAGLDLSDLEDHLAFAGPEGPQGDLGLAGLQGPTGEIGSQGSQGEVGETGLQGAPGEVGPQGEQGIAGPQGEQGAEGLQGPKGDTGDAGPQGPAGSGMNVYRGETLLGLLTSATADGTWYLDAATGVSLPARLQSLSNVFYSDTGCTGSPFVHARLSYWGHPGTNDAPAGTVVTHNELRFEVTGKVAESAQVASYLDWQGNCYDYGMTLHSDWSTATAGAPAITIAP